MSARKRGWEGKEKALDQGKNTETGIEGRRNRGTVHRHEKSNQRSRFLIARRNSSARA